MRRSEAIRAAIPVRTPDATRTPRRPRGRARQLTGEQLGALIEAYEAGNSTYVLAQRFAITRETIAAHLRRAGVPTRGLARVRLTAVQQEKAQRLWDDGVSYHRIGIALGVSERVVSRELRAATALADIPPAEHEANHDRQNPASTTQETREPRLD